ncbi:MAG: dihydrodipicolinate synthase family protein [Pseudomonadota bacterium]
MLTRENYRGVVVIGERGRHDDDKLDEDGLHRTLEFCFDAGVHGIVATANASEAGYLSEAERRRIAEIVVNEARGKAVSVVGVSTPCAALSIPFAQHAEAIGADAIMAMPPTFQKASEAEIRHYYDRLSQATKLPLVLQDFSGPGGTPMSAKLLADLARELPNAHFIKEETDFAPIVMSEINSLGGDAVHGIMGGKAGLKLMDEFRRGACGTMPACEVADVHVAVWKALEQGDMAAVRHMFRLLLPLISFEMGYGAAIYKEVLRRRGIIGSSVFRQTGGRRLDENAHAELTDILNELKPLMLEKYQP